MASEPMSDGLKLTPMRDWDDIETMRVQKAELLAEIDRLRGQLAEREAEVEELQRYRHIYYSHTGDNHHNALLCPYCNPDNLYFATAQLEADAETGRAVGRMPKGSLFRHFAVPFPPEVGSLDFVDYMVKIYGDDDQHSLEVYGKTPLAALTAAGLGDPEGAGEEE